ncbi:hypothetical protein PR048_032175 [Dryococelus australis]|uniref:Uncharacterized protein n=1 Tax=Dryococelus australis TaxID=614101 RepID=A0ABQ9G1G6_9NEOP|nr:hypothetical protein PR048_032175 [Dryococelus australis]
MWAVGMAYLWCVGVRSTDQLASCPAGLQARAAPGITRDITGPRCKTSAATPLPPPPLPNSLHDDVTPAGQRRSTGTFPDEEHFLTFWKLFEFCINTVVSPISRETDQGSIRGSHPHPSPTHRASGGAQCGRRRRTWDACPVSQPAPAAVGRTGTDKGEATPVSGILTEAASGRPAAVRSLAHPLAAAPLCTWLVYSPPTKANRVHVPAGLPPEIRKWESCRTMPLVGGFSQGSPVSPRPCISALLHTRLAPPSLLRAAQISSLTHSLFHQLRKYIDFEAYWDINITSEDCDCLCQGNAVAIAWRGELLSTREKEAVVKRGCAQTQDHTSARQVWIPHEQSLYESRSCRVYTSRLPPDSITGDIAPQIFTCENHSGGWRWSAGFIGDLPFAPPLRPDAAPYLVSHPSALNNSMITAAQISPLALVSAIPVHAGIQRWGKREIPEKPAYQRHSQARFPRTKNEPGATLPRIEPVSPRQSLVFVELRRDELEFRSVMNCVTRQLAFASTLARSKRATTWSTAAPRYWRTADHVTQLPVDALKTATLYQGDEGVPIQNMSNGPIHNDDVLKSSETAQQGPNACSRISVGSVREVLESSRCPRRPSALVSDLLRACGRLSHVSNMPVELGGVCGGRAVDKSRRVAGGGLSLSRRSPPPPPSTETVLGGVWPINQVTRPPGRRGHLHPQLALRPGLSKPRGADSPLSRLSHSRLGARGLFTIKTLTGASLLRMATYVNRAGDAMVRQGTQEYPDTTHKANGYVYPVSCWIYNSPTIRHYSPDADENISTVNQKQCHPNKIIALKARQKNCRGIVNTELILVAEMVGLKSHVGLSRTARRGIANPASHMETTAAIPFIESNLCRRGGPIPDFRMWESCRAMPLVGGFSRGSPVSPTPSFQRCSILPSHHPHWLSRPRF